MKLNKSLLLYCIILALLTFNFKMNILGSARNDFFNNFQIDSESLVVGRLIYSERYGIFSHAGFLGRVVPIPAGKNYFWYQYEVYHDPSDFDSYEAYYSQPALQGFVYGMLCRITGLNGYAALDFFKWLVSISTALIFTIFIIWVQRRWGWATALFTLLTVCLSQWVTVFGRNIFWVLGAFYLPFVAALWYLQKYEQNQKCPLRVTFCLMFFSMLIKCLLIGFEYITTTIIMAVTPWIFYAIVNEWDWKKFLKNVSVASAGILTAAIAVIIELAFQLSFVMGSISEGFRYILFSLGKRTYGGTGNIRNYDPGVVESTNSKIGDVLFSYWNGSVFNISHWFDFPLWQSISHISFGSCCIFLLFISFIVFNSSTIKQFSAFRKQQIALTAMLWVSLLAPLSWFVIFKGHSYAHTHMNHIVWHMPFMLLGATLTGSTVWFVICKKVSALIKKSKIKQSTCS